MNRMIKWDNHPVVLYWDPWFFSFLRPSSSGSGFLFEGIMVGLIHDDFLNLWIAL